MNPTGVLFIRQAGGERPASQADPATLSSSGIWHRNFNRRAAQAGRSVLETQCACQSVLTKWREHSECAVLLAWQSVTSPEDGEGGWGKQDGKWESCGKGIKRDNTETLSSYSGESGGGGWKAWLTSACWKMETTLMKDGLLLVIFYLCPILRLLSGKYFKQWMCMGTEMELVKCVIWD